MRNGLRVEKVAGGTTTVYIFSGAKVIAEYVNGASPTNPTREYVYAGGALLASTSGTTTTYYHQDHLSNRLVTDSTGAVAENLGAYPCGESWYNATNDKWTFTSYERDAESGNDYAMARYDVNRFGRFLSPDPLSGSAGDPQSLKHYTYTENDPVNAADPSGLTMITPNPSWFLGLNGGDMDGECTEDGVDTACGSLAGIISSGGAVQCPNNNCKNFEAFADGSAGYMSPSAPPGFSVKDIANALAEVTAAGQGQPIDPDQLTGQALNVYTLLLQLGVSAENISIFQTGTQSFTAVLTDAGFDQLEQSPLFASHLGDSFLHYPYTDGGRSDQTPSLHGVWFDEDVTDYVGGTGVYMRDYALDTERSILWMP